MLLTLASTAVMMFLMWRGADLRLSLRSGYIFIFSVLGLWLGVNKWMAIALIRARPALGAVE